MGKSLYIAEKPSVAREFATALHLNTVKRDGFLESEEAVITWCVGHLVTMSYPEVYDEKLKKWSLITLPFLPETFLYEVIPGVKKQFEIVKQLLNREDVQTIYVCTDSGREGEYIYRLVEQMSEVKEKERKRVWIDSQTEEEILRGIKEAKDLAEYDNLSNSAYLRAKEDYLMGINFSRLLSLKYGPALAGYMNTNYAVVSVGRVMTCVLGMVVKREREIRDFVKTPFYRIMCLFKTPEGTYEGEWKAVQNTKYFESPMLYKENGFKKEEDAKHLLEELKTHESGIVTETKKKKEVKNPPLLYNLAELQNECAKRFKISPDETLRVVQELYEKKIVTYPRTDARVLSSAVAKEIHKTLNHLSAYLPAKEFLGEIAESKSYKTIAKTRYVNDKQITDHYAIIPTGQGISSLKSCAVLVQEVYELIVKRFLSIFYPPAIYQKYTVVTNIGEEQFFSSFKVLTNEGYLKVLGNVKEQEENTAVTNIKKGMTADIENLEIKEGETSPPKRYNSGSIILAMENAGQLIEDEDLREQMKGSGIGTSATRAEILKKLVHINYLALNKKTQIITPDFLGEMIFDIVENSIKQLLNPELTASWEKGLSYVAEGEITADDYMKKLEEFISRRTGYVKQLSNQHVLRASYEKISEYYKQTKGSKKK